MNELSGITIPIYIKGSLSDPSISPDISAVITSFVTREYWEYIKTNPGKRVWKSFKGPEQLMIHGLFQCSSFGVNILFFSLDDQMNKCYCP